MKAVVLAIVCGSVAVSANRYECDTAAYLAVEDVIADLDYDQRYQQKDIDDFVEQLDDLKALAEGNNTCGAVEFHNSDSGSYSVILGGCENELDEGSDYSAIGGGQKNWGYINAKLVSIGGGLHNIATGDWTSILGGVKNKAYSNYAAVMGGYLNKANSKFATALGGSKNTVSGRYGLVMGQKTKVTGDYSIGLGFDSGNICNIRGDHTFGACSDSLILSGDFGEFDLLSELSSRRRLTEASDEVELLEKENKMLEAQVQTELERLLVSDRLDEVSASRINALLHPRLTV